MKVDGGGESRSKGGSLKLGSVKVRSTVFWSRYVLRKFEFCVVGAGQVFLYQGSRVILIGISGPKNRESSSAQSLFIRVCG